MIRMTKDIAPVYRANGYAFLKELRTARGLGALVKVMRKHDATTIMIVSSVTENKDYEAFGKWIGAVMTYTVRRKWIKFT